MPTWKCEYCGETHDTVPDNFCFDEPYHWGGREKVPPPPNCFLNDDYCVIDQTEYFIRGILEIPIHGLTDAFVIGAWTTLSKINFDREIELASDPARVHEPAYFGWFANQVWQYPNTLELKCHVVTGEPGNRPTILLEPTEHLLAVEQREGITQQRFQELSAQFLHGWKHPESGIR